MVVQETLCEHCSRIKVFTAEVKACYKCGKTSDADRYTLNYCTDCAKTLKVCRNCAMDLKR